MSVESRPDVVFTSKSKFSEAGWCPSFSWSNECVFAPLFEVFVEGVPDHSRGIAATYYCSDFDVSVQWNREAQSFSQTPWRAVLALMFVEVH